MTVWSVFFRRPSVRDSAPRLTFKAPLSCAALNDPAFSSDPLSHPHFPLAHATSYKAPLSKSPPSHSPSSPTPSSTSSPSPSSSAVSLPRVIPKPPQLLPKSGGTHTRAKKHASRNNSILRKARMSALFRRLTSHHSLDRIDELDETDPFGGSYHHDGPYEAIVSSIPQPTLLHQDSYTAPHRADLHHPEREFDPRSLWPSQHLSTSRVPSVHGEPGFSLRLQPGQILQRHPVYTSHVSSTTPLPSHSHPEPTTVARAARPDHYRSQSLPKPWTRSPQISLSLNLPDGPQNPLSRLHTPREHHRVGDNTPEIPIDLPPHHDRDTASYVLQAEKFVFPPPRYESRLQSSVPSRSPQHAPPPTSNPTSRRTQSTQPHEPRHKVIHSLGSPHLLDNDTTRSSSSIQSKPLEFTRIRHLPKRLVMPALLQPQQPQLPSKSPPSELAARKNKYLDDHDLEGAYFEGKPTMYGQEPRLLRKRPSTSSTRKRIPDHTPTFQDNAVPITGSSAAKTASGTVETKGGTRRRKLSKRKNDVWVLPSFRPSDAI